jgi:hypothetical protein
MAITPRPKRNQSDIRNQSQKEAAAQRFIDQAGQQSDNPPTKKRQNKEPVMIRIDPVLLDEIDEAARADGVSRSAWICLTCARELRSRKD